MKTDHKRKYKNVERRLRNWLNAGRKITHNKAQQLWSTNRLAAFIYKLRKDGMDIRMDWVKYNGDVFGEYYVLKKPKVSRIKTRQYMNQA